MPPSRSAERANSRRFAAGLRDLCASCSPWGAIRQTLCQTVQPCCPCLPPSSAFQPQRPQPLRWDEEGGRKGLLTIIAVPLTTQRPVAKGRKEGGTEGPLVKRSSLCRSSWQMIRCCSKEDIDRCWNNDGQNDPQLLYSIKIVRKNGNYVPLVVHITVFQNKDILCGKFILD